LEATPLPRSQGTTSTAQLTDILRRDILAGHLGPGERLVEVDLAQRYGGGRASVRSALVSLEKEGLVDRRANRGATVRRTTLAEAIQLTEARAVLEVLVARHAARHVDEAEQAELRSIVASMRRVVAEGLHAEYSDLNGRLHERLREISRHTVASGLIGNLRNRAAHLQFRLALQPGRPAQSLREHEAIVEAVVSRDEEAAGAAMERHILSVLHVLRHWDDLRVRV
jgi:DNA-binding GntR family transcriptional regulator